MKKIRFASVISLALCVLFVCPIKAQETKEPDQLPSNTPAVKKDQAISVGVEQLIEIQDEDGAWPYEGVYRVQRKIPVGYRIGGTAICCEALLYATTADNQPVNRAIERGIQLILTELEHPLMKPSQKDRYDVRVWGHIYALDLFCRLKADKNRFPKQMDQIEAWIPKLTESLLQEALENGGWNYASRRSHAGFVTSPAVQALLWAQQSGQEIPAEVLKRAAEVLFRSRNNGSAFAYSGYETDRSPTKLPGSIARSAICETTLSLLGLERQNAIQQSIDAFHEHWNELEKRRKKTGTHKPPYGIAPYYFYYGHRYVAQAIGRLPMEKQAAEFARLYDVILKTRDPDGTWNDRVFKQSRAYGTAMILLAITAEKVPMPDRVDNLETQIWVGEVAKPDLIVELQADGDVKLFDKTFPATEMAAWLEENPPKRRPTVVIIKCDPSVETGVVEEVKKSLRKHLGGFMMYVDLDEVGIPEKASYPRRDK